MVLVTCSSEKEASELAGKLVEGKLAACVNITGVQSVYMWKGKIENEPEKLLIVKTTETKIAELEKFIKESHSYECPEIIALEIKSGSKEYLEWVHSTVNE